MRVAITLGPVLLACLLALPALADEPGSVTTHATARRRLPNTAADVSLGIEAHGAAVAAVHRALAAGAAPLLAYLRGAGAERLRTDQIAVTPDTETARGHGLPDRITGYTGRLSLSFRIAAEKLPDVLGGAMDKGGNSLEGTSMTPREAEMDAARQELAAEATRIALDQAAAVARQAGRRLGAIRQIVVDPGLGLAPRPLPMFAAARMAAAPIAAEAGDTELAATVSVVVSLVEP